MEINLDLRLSATRTLDGAQPGPWMGIKLFVFLDFYKLVDLEISCRGPWLKNSELSYASSYGRGRFGDF